MPPIPAMEVSVSMLIRAVPRFLLLAMLAACAAAPAIEAVSATGDEVVFAYRGDQAPEAARQASLYCANLGRSARLRAVTGNAGERRVATFDCRPEG